MFVASPYFRHVSVIATHHPIAWIFAARALIQAVARVAVSQCHLAICQFLSIKNKKESERCVSNILIDSDEAHDFGAFWGGTALTTIADLPRICRETGTLQIRHARRPAD
ncbi:hypothetical protein [Paraburkholderia oxyphila]|uniref:hypothetical protein n=1 Tax=Paraburkholderia oxyphila TaxID=614212 RepID=UPI0012EE1C34|nr:hypothetical protein [Paraburkholderia oxyphila]